MRIQTSLQGLIVVVLAMIVGGGLFYLVRQDDEEGFLGLANFEVSTVPQTTPEPTEVPIQNAEPTIVPNTTAEPSATSEPIERAEPTVEPNESTSEGTDEDSFSELNLEDNTSNALPQESDRSKDSEATVQSFPAPLGADVNVLFQWFAFLGLLVGGAFAVRKDFTTHRNIMTFLVLVNWFSVTGRMTRNVEGYLEAKTPTYSQDVIYLHAIFGILVCIFASYLVLRMWFEKKLPEFAKVKNIKLWMRTTLASWLLLIVIGTYMYFDIYSS
ncbi:MAG: hypothetical protein CUN55_10165 [Phototrophicales bacterium]|nr:MAG: hypothetical protein CUN55_10165 [Phototrophicales bacterium]